MDAELTEIVFILDESGSMDHLTKDTIGGFNGFVEKQKQEPGRALITLVKFNTVTRFVYSGISLNAVEPLTEKGYTPNGGTALLDAIGITIDKVGCRLDLTPEDKRPSKVLFVITTDGEENSSREYSAGKVREMVDLQTETYKWQFIFIGANIDAIATAKDMGIAMAASYTANSVGTQSLYESVSRSASLYRVSGEIKEDWDKDIK